MRHESKIVEVRGRHTHKLTHSCAHTHKMLCVLITENISVCLHSAWCAKQ